MYRITYDVLYRLLRRDFFPSVVGLDSDFHSTGCPARRESRRTRGGCSGSARHKRCRDNIGRAMRSDIPIGGYKKKKMENFKRKRGLISLVLKFAIVDQRFTNGWSRGRRHKMA